MEKKRANLLRLWSPVIFWAVLIFAGSSLPAISTSRDYWSDFVVKKTVHLTEYFILYLLAWRALKHHFPKHPFWIAFFFLVLYASSDEFHQSFVFGRESRARDVIIDATGALFGIWFLKNLLPKMPAKLKNWLNASPKS